jgi:hypothetical protein
MYASINPALIKEMSWEPIISQLLFKSHKMANNLILDRSKVK